MCDQKPTWHIEFGRSPDHYTVSCSTHLGEMAEGSIESANKNLSLIAIIPLQDEPKNKCCWMPASSVDPRRKYVVTIRVDGHTWEDAVNELTRLVDHMIEHGEDCGQVGGGGPSGGSVNVDIHPTMTPEQYEQDLQAWAQARREEKTEAAQPGHVRVMDAASGEVTAGDPQDAELPRYHTIIIDRGLFHPFEFVPIAKLTKETTPTHLAEIEDAVVRNVEVAVSGRLAFERERKEVGL